MHRRRRVLLALPSMRAGGRARSRQWFEAALLLIIVNYGYAWLFDAVVFRHELCDRFRCVGIRPSDPVALIVLLTYGAAALRSNVGLFSEGETRRAEDGVEGGSRPE